MHPGDKKAFRFIQLMLLLLNLLDWEDTWLHSSFILTTDMYWMPENSSCEATVLLTRKKYFVLLVDNGTKSTHWSFTSPLPCAKKTNENNLILTFDLCFICTPPCQLTFGDERWNSFTGRLGMAGALWCTFVFLSHSACYFWCCYFDNHNAPDT